MIEKLYRWYGRKTVWSVAAAVVVLLIIGILIKLNLSKTTEEVAVLPTVKVATVSELSGNSTVSILGSVRAVSEANLQTESSGRVTSVRVSLGDQVTAGSVIATLENASQQAAVLQAEGVYEAALAAGAQSDIGVTEATNAVTGAKNSAVSAIRSAYTTNGAVVLNTLDQFYSDPQSFVPGVRLSAGSYTAFLNSERVAYEQLLEEWPQKQNLLTVNTDLQNEITLAKALTLRTSNLIDIFTELIVREDQNRYSASELEDFQADLISARVTLNGVLSSLDTASNNLTSAEETLSRIQLGGTNTDVSTANAQIKQALGALRSAQANLAKTIIRTPIAGTVNSLTVDVGDFVGTFAPVAKIANNNALEITTFVGASDLANIEVGQTVTIENQYDGVVTSIGAGVDSQTQKTEVKIGTDTSDLTNGDSVTISLDGQSAIKPDSKILIPITAVKFSAEDGFVFTVNDEVLQENPVEIGAVRGGFVEINSGLSPEMEIVVDARGLTVGSRVESVK